MRNKILYADGLNNYIFLYCKLNIFLRINPPCKDCLVRSMCIVELHSGYGIKVRVCEDLYKYFQMVKRNDKNLIRFK